MQYRPDPRRFPRVPFLLLIVLVTVAAPLLVLAAEAPDEGNARSVPADDNRQLADGGAFKLVDTYLYISGSDSSCEDDDAVRTVIGCAVMKF